jgi:hypothetical protein
MLIPNCVVQINHLFFYITMASPTTFVTSVNPTTLGSSIDMLDGNDHSVKVSQCYTPGQALEFVIPPSNNNITSILAEFKLVIMNDKNVCISETAFGGTVNMNPNAGAYGLFSSMILRRAFNTTTIEAITQANRVFCTKGFSAHSGGTLTGSSAGNYCDPSLLQQSYVPSQVWGHGSSAIADMTTYSSIIPLCFSLPFSTLNTSGVALPLNTVGGITIQLSIAQPYDFLVSMYGEGWYSNTMLNVWAQNRDDSVRKITFAIIAPRLVYLSENATETEASITLPTRSTDIVRTTANYGLIQNFGWAFPNGIYRQVQVYLLKKSNINTLAFGTNATLAFNTFNYKLLLNGIQQIWAYPTDAFPVGSQMSSFMPNEFVYWMGSYRDTVKLDRLIWGGAMLSIPFDLSGNGIPINQTSINNLLTLKTRSVQGNYGFPFYPLTADGDVYHERYTPTSTITAGARFDLPVLQPMSLTAPFYLGDNAKVSIDTAGTQGAYVSNVHEESLPPYAKYNQYGTTSSDNELMIVSEKTQGIIIEDAGNTIVPIAPVVRTLDKLLNFKLAPPISTVERTQLYQISGGLNFDAGTNPEVTFLLPSSGTCNGSAFVTLRLIPRLNAAYPEFNDGYNFYTQTGAPYDNNATYSNNAIEDYQPITLIPGKSPMTLATFIEGIFNDGLAPVTTTNGTWNANVDWYGTCSWSSKLKFGSIYSSARVQYPNNVTVRFDDYLEKVYLDNLAVPVTKLSKYYQFTRHPVQSLVRNNLNNSLFDDPFKLQAGGAYPKCMWLMPYFAGAAQWKRNSLDARCDHVVTLPLPPDIVALIDNIPFSASTKIYLTLTIATSPDGYAFVSSGLGRGCITADPVGFSRGRLPNIWADFTAAGVAENQFPSHDRETDYYVTVDPTYTPKLWMYLNYEAPTVQGSLTKNAQTEGVTKTVTQYLIQDARWQEGGIKEVRDEVNIAGRNPPVVYYLTRHMLSSTTGRRAMTDKPGTDNVYDLFVVPHHLASTVGCGAYSVPISILPYATGKNRGKDIAHNAGTVLTPVDVTIDGTLCFPTALNTDAMNALCFLMATGNPLLNFSQEISFPNFRHTHTAYKGVPGLLSNVKPATNATFNSCWYSYYNFGGPAQTCCKLPPTFSQATGHSWLPTNAPFVVPILASSRNGSILKLRFNGPSDPNVLSFNWLLGTSGQYTQAVANDLIDNLAITLALPVAGYTPKAVIEINNRNPIQYDRWDWHYGLTSICIPYTQTLNFNEVSATLTTNFPAGYDI